MREVREQVAQVGVGVADEAGLVVVAEQRLEHGQGHQLSVGELRGDADRGPVRDQVRVVDQQIIDDHVEFGGESVQGSVHAGSFGITVCGTPLILDALARYVVDTRAVRNPWN